MPDFLPLLGTDYVEFYVGNAKQSAHYYITAFGFQPVAYCGPETGVKDHASYVLQQNKLRFVLTCPLKNDGPIADHVSKHGDGVKFLSLTVDDAADFFGKAKEKTCVKIVDKLKLLQDVGLGYVQLGQSSSTLSGGEAQRIKLASFLGTGQNSNNTLFVFDEPTTGLHFNDINKLLASFNALIEQGHSIIVIEHNTDVIRSADWVIDLGPEAGDAGGNLVFAGKPADLKKEKKSFTAKYL